MTRNSNTIVESIYRIKKSIDFEKLFVRDDMEEGRMKEKKECRKC